MATEKLPNMIFVLSDQHRFCDVGYQGNTQVETPNLDELAQTGAAFTSAYSNCPVCVPARGSLLTSLHALRHGAAANDLPVNPRCNSIAHVLNEAGYHTAYIGKWHLGGTPRDQFVPYYNRLGFQYWRANNCNHNYLKGYYDTNDNKRHPIDGYAPIGETDLALEFLRKQDGPFAMFLCFGTPHDPYTLLPPGDLERYLERDLLLRGNCEPEPREGEWTYAGYDLKKFYAGYYAHIRQIDIQIGRIRQWLRESGQEENTIFVYTSDHGDMLGSHGYLHKQMYYEESAKIPLVISWPGHIPGGSRRQPISLVDLAPTLLALAGLKFDTPVDGVDMSAAVMDAKAQGQEAVYLYSYVPCHQASNRKVPSWRAVTNGRQILVADENRTLVAMYDMENDPLQQHDIQDSPAHRQLLQTLLGVLDAEVKKHDGYMPWRQLLKEHQLADQWEESESFFEGVFTNKK